MTTADPVQGPSAVLVVALDRLRAVDDAWGRGAGDAVLAATAAAIAEEMRGDHAGHRADVRRVGAGFVVLMSGPPAARPVGVVADAVRRRVARLRVAVDTGRGPVTISDATVCVGAAAEHPGRVGTTMLLWSADSALHAARRSGCDAVRVAGGVWSDPAPRSAWRGPLG